MRVTLVLARINSDYSDGRFSRSVSCGS